MPVIRWVLETAVFRPFATFTLTRGGRSLTKAAPRITKMSESLWKLTAYGTMVFLELTIIWREEWFWKPRDYWVGWPNHPELPLMRLLFHCQLAYYGATTFMLGLWEVPRSDYWVMQTHHVCTLVAIYLNYMSGYQRWGCLIMLLHDTTDVIMEVAKNLNYADFELASTSVFVMFMVSWVALRLTAFPFVLIRSTMFDSTRVLGYTPPYHGVLNALLCVLCCFHVYWFGLILQVAINTVKQGKSKDIREQED